MMVSGGNGNPFRPGAGQMPPFLAGRDAELSLAERRLRQLAGGTAPPPGILLYGPRGNGKTVLLERITERAGEMGLRAERLPPAALRDGGQLVRSLQRRARLMTDRLTGLHLGPLGATAERAVRSREVSERAVEEAVAARVSVERFYMERFDEATEREVAEALAPLAEAMTRRGGRLGDREIRPLLRTSPRGEPCPSIGLRCSSPCVTSGWSGRPLRRSGRWGFRASPTTSSSAPPGKAQRAPGRGSAGFRRRAAR